MRISAETRALYIFWENYYSLERALENKTKKMRSTYGLRDRKGFFMDL